jgi:hypothetical protein
VEYKIDTEKRVDIFSLREIDIEVILLAFSNVMNARYVELPPSTIPTSLYIYTAMQKRTPAGIILPFYLEKGDKDLWS